MMESNGSLVLKLSLAISIPTVFSYIHNPVVVVTQGVIEKNGHLPISIFWYYPGFTKGDVLEVRNFNRKNIYRESFPIDRYTGFRELPLSAPEDGDSPGNYCAIIQTRDDDYHENSSCESKFQWMYDLRNALKFFTLRDLIIPGTHSSAAYTTLDRFSSNRDPRSHGILTQTDSIKTQLLNGVRYLDFRPDIKNVMGRIQYYLIHNDLSLILFDDVVKQINEFMDLSKDIVIVSFSQFSSAFNCNEDHLLFMLYLEFSFENHMHARTSWKYTLDEFWNDERRLIITYDNTIRESSRFMWPPITQYLANIQTVNQLHSHLTTIHESHENDNIPYAVVLDSTYSEETSRRLPNNDTRLREWSERLSRHIPLWYTEEFNISSNIVLVNFYQTSGIVDVAIQLNEKRSDYFIEKP